MKRKGEKESSMLQFILCIAKKISNEEYWNEKHFGSECVVECVFNEGWYHLLNWKGMRLRR